MPQRVISRPTFRKYVGRQQHGRRLNVGVIRYRLRVGKTFPELLSEAIESWYASDSDFARRAGVSSSAVSRWIAGLAVPTVPTLEKIAPYLRLPAAALIAVAYPGTGSVAADPTAVPIHPLAVDVDRLLSEESPLPEDERATLATLLEHVISPYRRHLRRRRAS